MAPAGPESLNPEDMTVKEIAEAAPSLPEEQKVEVAEAERRGKNRAGALEALGAEKDPDGVRRSGTGRILEPQEADPVIAAKASLADQLVKQQVEESEG